MDGLCAVPVIGDKSFEKIKGRYIGAEADYYFLYGGPPRQGAHADHDRWSWNTDHDYWSWNNDHDHWSWNDHSSWNTRWNSWTSCNQWWETWTSCSVGKVDQWAFRTAFSHSSIVHLHAQCGMVSEAFHWLRTMQISQDKTLHKTLPCKGPSIIAVNRKFTHTRLAANRKLCFRFRRLPVIIAGHLVSGHPTHVSEVYRLGSRTPLG